MDVMEKRVNREVLRHAVSRVMFCPISGKCLDVRTAVLFTITKDGKSGYRCVDGTAWDGMADATAQLCGEAGATLEVIDGRTL